MPCERLTRIWVLTDNLAVYNGYHKGPQTKHGNLDDLWETFWEIFRKACETGWFVTLGKVKSHCGIKEIAQGTISFQDVQGNAMADTWAGHGATLEEYPAENREHISKLDGTAWIIQSRIMAVCTLYLEKAEKETHDPKPRKDKHVAALEALGHLPSAANAGWRKCYLCGQCWSEHSRWRMERLGRCPGPNLWTPVQNAPVETWKVPQGTGLIHNGQALHPSHAFKWHRGIIYCSTCGNFSVKKVVNLATQCQMKCIGSYGTNVLKRLQAGKVPYPGCKFPVDTDTCPAHIAARL
jgi:hypothetical protein